MKSKILFATILCGCVFYTVAETWSMNGTDAQYPGMCVYKGEPFVPGEHKLQKECVKIICGENSWISRHSCVPQKLAGCKPGELAGIRRPFPDCCRRFYHCHNEVEGDFVVEDF